VKEKANSAHKSNENYQARIDKAQKKLDDEKAAGTITEEEVAKKQAKIEKAKEQLAKMKKHLEEQDAKMKEMETE
jgi:multidrug resistance efflux pump